MKTTQIFIDHLITGTLALIWITFISLTFTGISVENSPSLEGYETILIMVLLSVVYPLGIISDNMADRLLKKWSKKIRSSVANGDGNKSMRKLLLKLNNGSVTEYFDYLRTRIRLCRSAGVNFCLITISSFLFVYFHVYSNLRQILLFLVPILGTVLTSLAFFSWKLLMETFAKGIAKRYKELEHGN